MAGKVKYLEERRGDRLNCDEASGGIINVDCEEGEGESMEYSGAERDGMGGSMEMDVVPWKDVGQWDILVLRLIEQWHMKTTSSSVAEPPLA
eukprot:7340405-Ditylum_brightwellii.AAC.2